MGRWGERTRRALREGGHSRTRVLLTAAGVGGMTGVRSMAGPALLTWGVDRPGRLERLLLRNHDGALERVLTSSAAGRVLPALAAGEALADKLPWIPARTEPLPLLARAGLGALAGAVVGRRAGAGVLLPALVGGAAAVALASLATAGRRAAHERLRVPNTALGLLEDGVVAAAGAALVSAID